VRHRRDSAKWNRLKKYNEKVNNQPEVAIVAMVTAVVVAWRQNAVRHCRGTVKWNRLQKKEFMMFR